MQRLVCLTREQALLEAIWEIHDMALDLLGGLLDAVGQLLGGDSGNPVDGLGDGLGVGLDKGTEAGNNGLLGVVGGAAGGIVGLLIGAADNLGDSLDKIPVLGGVLHLGSDLVDGLAVTAVAIVDGALSLGDTLDLGPISQVLNGDTGGLVGGLGTGLQLGVEYGAEVSGAGLAGSVGGIVGGLLGFANGTLENIGIDLGLGGDDLPSQGDYLL